MNGYQYEEQCAKYLLSLGYYDVEVTKKSGDFGIDIIAFYQNLKYGVQCKYYDSAVGNKAIQEAYAGAAYYNCNKAIVITNSIFTKSAHELASNLDVILLENIDAIKLFEAGKYHKQELLDIQATVESKINNTHNYVIKVTEQLQSYLERNPLSTLSTYTATENKCISILTEIQQMLNELKKPPCSKIATNEMIMLMHSVNTLYISLHTEERCSGFSEYASSITFSSIIHTWNDFSNSLPYLEYEKQLIKTQAPPPNFQIHFIESEPANEAPKLPKHTHLINLHIGAKNLFILILLISAISWLLIKGIIVPFIDNKKLDELEIAIQAEDWEKAKEINNYFFNKKDYNYWYENSMRIENAYKASLPIVERIETYPEDYIHISIPYMTHYLSGVVEYGLEIENSSAYDVTISSVTIESRESNSEQKISTTIHVNANSNRSSVLTIGKGNKNHGGSYTITGHVDGGNAYICSNFSLTIEQ